MTNLQPEEIAEIELLSDEGEDNHDYGDLLDDEIPPEEDD